MPGDGLTAADQPEIGATLARAHRALQAVPAGAADVVTVDPAAAHVDVRPWIRPQVAAVAAAYAAADPASFTTGLLHSDPAPEAFRRDPGAGACGLIDWSTAVTGPLLAGAVSRSGG